MEERSPIPTWYFVLVVVRHGPRFLLVREARHGQKWYLPAGRVQPGESLVSAARRETLEESGVPVALDGVLKVEHSPLQDGTARVRVIFLAHPLNDTPPKSKPDEQSLAAAWVSLSELEELPLRGAEVRRLFWEVEYGAPVYPLWLLGIEGQPLLPWSGP